MEAITPASLERRSAEPARRVKLARLVRRRPAFALGVLLVLIYVVVAVVGPDLTLYAPTKTNPRVTLRPPSAEFPFGTDKFGRDVLTRVVHATRLDLAIAASVAMSAFAIGSLIGGVAGYYGGWLDDVVMRVVDVLFAFPAFILAMAITGVLGDTVQNVVIAIATAYVPYFIRLTRGEMLTVRTLQYADAALSVGNPRWRVMLIHLLPNALTPSLVQVALVFAWAILDAAGLAFLGLGITPPTAEWGVLVSEGAQRIITGEWWVWLFPGAAIVLAAFAFSLVGDGLRDISAHEER
ncbi:MAG TPA: ABC transporter permease [Anaerolineae bacterium]|nr:ABC transporter permease [Anaerolineae bacterium]